MSNMKSEPLEMGLYSLNFSDGLPKNRGLRISPFEITLGKSELRSYFYGDVATEWLGAGSLLEKASGNREITFPGGSTWSSKASAPIQRF